MARNRTVRKAVGRRARAEAPAGPESKDTPEPQAQPEPDEGAAKWREEKAALQKQLRELDGKVKAAERAKLTADEQIKAERDELKAQLAERDGELGSLRKEKRLDKFQEQVAALAQGVPPRRLKALLRELEGEGFDVAPEVATKASAQKALDRLKELDPDSFAPKGNPPPVPAGERGTDGKIDWKLRGAMAAGRVAKSKKSAAARKRRKQ